MDALPPAEVVVFEGYLYKLPPLDKLQLLSSWKKQYFVLSCINLVGANEAQLSFYSDQEKRKRKGVIDLTTVVNVNPAHKSTGKENVFSLDTPDKSYLLRASDHRIKNLWVAKLLECCAKDHQTYHVTLPSQPLVKYIEGVLKLSAPLQVLIVSPANGAQIMTIPFDKIRRFGCEVAADFDIVWFETCGCRGVTQQFFYFAVPSGIEVAHTIVNEIKQSIEVAIRSFLIQEENDKERCQLTYISRTHYGCGEYSIAMRQNIIQKGLVSITGSPSRSDSQRHMSAIHRLRRASEVSAIPTDSKRKESVDKPRRSLADIKGTPQSLSTSHRSVSPSDHLNSSGTRITLSSLNQKSLSMAYTNSRNENGLSSSAGSGDFPKRNNSDPSRHSAPSHYNVSEVRNEKVSTSLKSAGKMLSLDEIGTVSKFQKQKRTREAVINRDKDSHLESVSPYSHLSPQPKTFVSMSLPERGRKASGKKMDLSASFNGIALRES